ncbi:MAG: FKBP-type peptidyl-prolyl cis-trans isomerase [Frankiaceae bacterium]
MPQLPAVPARPSARRRRPVRRAAVVSALALCPVLALAGCSGGSGNAASPPSSSSTGSGAAGATGPLPTASGSYGDKPTLTFPGAKPSGALQTKVLEAGSGPVVKKGDLLVADYLGQIWRGKVFDNSYDRHQAAAFEIGTGKVIPGWDEGLVGVKSGSRVMLVIPPAKGYGSQGNAQAGIKGTDTLAFVVDVVQSFGKGAAAGTATTSQHARTPGITVTGPVGKQPKVTVAKGTKVPTKPTATLLDKGSGPVVKPGLLVVEYEAVTWDGKSAGSTWQAGAPVGAPVGASSQGQQGSPFDSLVGMPVGSRALITLPGQQGSPATSSVAAVVDIVAQPPTAKEAAKK